MKKDRSKLQNYKSIILDLNKFEDELILKDWMISAHIKNYRFYVLYDTIDKPDITELDHRILCGKRKKSLKST